MKRFCKFFALPLFVLCVSLMFAACGSGTENKGDTDDGEKEEETPAVETIKLVEGVAAEGTYDHNGTLYEFTLAEDSTVKFELSSDSENPTKTLDGEHDVHLQFQITGEEWRDYANAGGVRETIEDLTAGTYTLKVFGNSEYQTFVGSIKYEIVEE